MLNVSISPCPNDTFSFYHYLVCANKEKNQVNFEDIQTLNERALKNNGDVIKVSIAVYPLIQENYIILDSGAALGRSCGPLLIAKKKIQTEDIRNLRIALPGLNTSANRLFNLLYPQHKNHIYTTYEKVMAKIDSGEVDAGVIIHENRFTYQAKGFTLISDLGELWANQYSEWLPLGCVVAKKSMGLQKIKQISEQITESIQWAFQNRQNSDLQKFIQQHAQELDPTVINQHINLYVNEYSLQLGNLGCEAILNFLSNNLNKNKPCFISDLK